MFDSQDLAVEALARELEMIFPQWPEFLAQREGARWLAYAAVDTLCFRGESAESPELAHLDLMVRISDYYGLQG